MKSLDPGMSEEVYADESRKFYDSLNFPNVDDCPAVQSLVGAVGELSDEVTRLEESIQQAKSRCEELAEGTATETAIKEIAKLKSERSVFLEFSERRQAELADLRTDLETAREESRKRIAAQANEIYESLSNEQVEPLRQALELEMKKRWLYDNTRCNQTSEWGPWSIDIHEFIQKMEEK